MSATCKWATVTFVCDTSSILHVVEPVVVMVCVCVVGCRCVVKLAAVTVASGFLVPIAHCMYGSSSVVDSHADQRWINKYGN